MKNNQDNLAKMNQLESMLEDDPVKHVYRLDRAAFTDEELFEMEMKYIFEGNWVFWAMKASYPTSTTTSRCTSVASRW